MRGGGGGEELQGNVRSWWVGGGGEEVEYMVIYDFSVSSIIID